jgi:hypothetical protein
VNLHVVPFHADWHPALDGPFVIVAAERAAPVVHLEGRTQSLLLSDSATVTAYQRAAESVRQVALTADDSIVYMAHLRARTERMRDDNPTGMAEVEPQPERRGLRGGVPSPRRDP